MKLTSELVTQRKFTLELTEDEAQSIRTIIGCSKAEEFEKEARVNYGLNADRIQVLRAMQTVIFNILAEALPMP